jgi:hypothetical protein
VVDLEGQRMGVAQTFLDFFLCSRAYAQCNVYEGRLPMRFEFPCHLGIGKLEETIRPAPPTLPEAAGR